MSMAIEIDDLSYAHKGAQLPALERVSFQIPAGECVALLGPSGAGKTTLLALLDGRIQGWGGHVSVLGAPLNPDRPPPRARRPDTGFVFQEFALVERSPIAASQNSRNAVSTVSAEDSDSAWLLRDVWRRNHG